MIGRQSVGEASSVSLDARVHSDSAKDFGFGDEE